METMERKKQRSWNKEQYFYHLIHYMRLSKKFGLLELSMRKSHEAIAVSHELGQYPKLNEVRRHISNIYKQFEIGHHNDMSTTETRSRGWFEEWCENGQLNLMLGEELSEVIDNLEKWWCSNHLFMFIFHPFVLFEDENDQIIQSTIKKIKKWIISLFILLRGHQHR